MQRTTPNHIDTSTNSNSSGEYLSQLGLFFDQTRCTGCYACVIACKDWHDIPPGPANWIRINTIEKGKYPHPFLAFTINVCYHCTNAPCLEACPSNAISKRSSDGIVVVDQDRCIGKDECGQSCSYQCPAGNDILGFVSLIREEKYAEAWKLIIESNPFPGVCGRVCFHPCESACNRNQVDEPIAIQALERFTAEYNHPFPPFTIEQKEQRVAVVGSGPAGLSCAYHLARYGYRVTVFEALRVAGGMLQVGIPDYRLPKSIVNREINFIKTLGIDIKTNHCVGRDINFEELNEFDAVFIAVGAHREKHLHILGINLKEVLQGVQFLKGVNLNKFIEIGKRVVVIGGGNVACDCARTSLRLGADEVHLVCPERREEMPAEPSEIQQCAEEGIVIHTSQLVEKILETDGHVSGVECLCLHGMAYSEDGKLAFNIIDNSETVLSADTIILAIGQEPDLGFLPEDIKIDKGIISVSETGATTRNKYFAGGDAANTERRVASAVGSGRKAAKSIDQFLRGLSNEEAHEKPEKKYSFIDTDFINKKDRATNTWLPIANRYHNFNEVDLGLDRKGVISEASRCLNCRGMCSVACPYDSPQFGAEDNPKMQKCDLCLDEWKVGGKPICVRSCTMRALDAGPLYELRNKYEHEKECEGFKYYQKTGPAILAKPKRYRKPNNPK